jgi:hypothetical protein
MSEIDDSGEETMDCGYPAIYEKTREAAETFVRNVQNLTVDQLREFHDSCFRRRDKSHNEEKFFWNSLGEFVWKVQDKKMG